MCVSSTNLIISFHCFYVLQVFESLSFLDFEGCKLLTELPSLSGLVNLGALCLDDCTNLIAIHKSVGFLNKLVLLSTQRCNQLKVLVPNINLPSLETLDMRGCSRLKSFPEVLGVMENIRDVYLDQTSIDKLPVSIGNLVGLERLFLRECKSLTQLPDNICILPKLEIIMVYDCRGFQLFEDQEKVGSKVFPKAMLVCNEGKETLLDVYSLNICANNDIEVRKPLFVSNDFGFVFKGIFEGKVNWYQQGIKESSLCFWFRKKFPQIALCCAGEPPMYKDNMLLDFKLCVLINGTKQFTSSCNYIFSAGSISDQILMCDLVGLPERSFLEHEWNKVEILYELKYPMPRGFERIMANHDRTKTRNPSWSLIYVSGHNKEDVKFLSEFMECKEAERRKETLLGFHHMLKRYGFNWTGL